MSKVSVFKFNTNGVSKEFVEKTIKEYLDIHGFAYNYNHNCYIAGTADESLANMNVASAVTDQIRGKYVNTTNLQVANSVSCFSYYFTNNQLVITAYVYNSFSGIKSYIQPSINTIYAAKLYYDDIYNNLFITLNNNNIILVSSEKEKIKDGSSMNLFKKTMIIIIPIIIVFAIITIIAYLKSHS